MVKLTLCRVGITKLCNFSTVHRKYLTDFKNVIIFAMNSERKAVKNILLICKQA